MGVDSFTLTDQAYRQISNRHKASLSRKRRTISRACGICSNCCCRKRKASRMLCASCLKKSRLRYSEEMKWRLANNICTRCGVPKGENATKWKCRKCADIHATKQRARSERRRNGQGTEEKTN